MVAIPVAPVQKVLSTKDTKTTRFLLGRVSRTVRLTVSPDLSARARCDRGLQDFLQTAIVHRVGHLPEGLRLAAGLPLLVAKRLRLAQVHFGHQQIAVAGVELAKVRGANEVCLAVVAGARDEVDPVGAEPAAPMVSWKPALGRKTISAPFTPARGVPRETNCHNRSRCRSGRSRNRRRDTRPGRTPRNISGQCRCVLRYFPTNCPLRSTRNAVL